MQAIDYIQLLPEITRRILSISDPEQIILFGSYARGDHHPDSDIDLLIIMKHVDSPRSESVRLRRALRGLLVPVDIIVATEKQIERYRGTIGYIYKAALDEGRAIYDRSASS